MEPTPNPLFVSLFFEWPDGTSGGLQFTFRLLDPYVAPIDKIYLGLTRQRDRIL